MGQYYKPVIIRGNSVKYLYSHDYCNGLKLMEHSYLGNNFVNAVTGLIFNRPACIAWMGDYSDGRYGDAWETRIPDEKFSAIFQRVWKDEKQRTRILPTALNGYASPEAFDGTYLMNHTQKIYIDLGEYAERNKWKEEYNGETFTMCIHPLPLLTACGNDRGGGDYHSGHPDFDKVGSWAFDKISFATMPPKGYTKVSYHFTEEE